MLQTIRNNLYIIPPISINVNLRGPRPKTGPYVRRRLGRRRGGRKALHRAGVVRAVLRLSHAGELRVLEDLALHPAGAGEALLDDRLDRDALLVGQIAERAGDTACSPDEVRQVKPGCSPLFIVPLAIVRNAYDHLVGLVEDDGLDVNRLLDGWHDALRQGCQGAVCAIELGCSQDVCRDALDASSLLLMPVHDLVAGLDAAALDRGGVAGGLLSVLAATAHCYAP